MALASRAHRFLRVTSSSINISQNRKVMSSPFRANKVAEELQNNPYYEKYSKKIAALQNTSPEEFLSRLQACHEQKGKKSGSSEGRSFSTVVKPKDDITKVKSPVFTKEKVLDDVMKMDLIVNKDAEEIKHIWEDYHKQRDVIAAVIPISTYETIYSRSQQFPIFLFPIPRDQGYEFILCQFSGHEAHFTPLINYQAHKENAPECLTMIHYIDLQEKGIVLMRGEYNKDVLNGTEAQCLANQLQLYYGQDNEKRLNLLERFTYNPQDFKHMDLIADLECLSL